MDLNPVEVKDIYDFQISQNIQIKEENNFKFIFNSFYKENIYSDSRIDKMVRNIREKTLNRLILEALIFVESNDHIHLLNIVHCLKEIRFSKNITTEEAELLILLLDKYIKRNFHDFNFLNDIFSLLNDLLSMKNIQLKLDWRVYYMMFIQFYGISKKEFASNYSEKFLQKISLCDFVKKARKFFFFTKEDYDHLKEEVLLKLTTIDGYIAFGLLEAQLFIPEEYFKDDAEFQEKLITILENQTKHANSVMLNFSKIIKYGIKIDKLRFIENLFSVMFCLLSDGMTLTYFYWPDSINKDRHCTISVCYLLGTILLKSEYDQFYETILKKFNILLNLISTDLTENNCSSFTFDFIKLFLRNVKHLASYVNEHEVSEYDSFNEYTILDVYQEKVKTIIKMLKPIISKCFLYNDSSTYSLFIEYLALTDNSKIHLEFHDIITHLSNNSFNDYNFFIKKITIFLRSFFYNLEKKETFEFLINLIETSADKISCANEALNRNIIDFFNVLYAICMSFKDKMNTENFPEKSRKNLNTLQVKINEVTISIIKKILRLISFFSNVIKEMQLELFLYHMDKIISIETRKEICKIISTHLKNTTIKEDSEFQMIIYLIQFLKLDADSTNSFEDIQQCRVGKDLWNFCYYTLVEQDFSMNNSSHHITFKLRENSKDQFTYIKKLLTNCVEYDDVNEEEFFTLMSLLLKDKQDKKKLAFQMLKYLCYNILLPTINKNKISYPNEEKLKLIIKIYYRIIQPYEISLQQQLETVRKISDSPKVEQQGLIIICKKELEELDETMSIYLRITHSFMHKCNNIFMKDINNFELDLKEIISSFQEIVIYQEIKTIQHKIFCNLDDFYRLLKKLKIINKSEKYFRRNFSSKLLDLDRFYHVRLISNYRKYIVYYREFEFKELHFIYKNLLNSSMYSHIKLFKFYEKPDFTLIERIFKMYIDFEDKKLIDSSLFKISYMIKNLEPDSSEAYEFFAKIVDLLEKKLNEIPITKEILVNDVKKFERIIDILYGFVENFSHKISDVSLILRTLNKFRMIIDKFKFSTATELEYLTILTDSMNYKLHKPVTFFKIKTAQAFSNFVNNLEFSYHNSILEKMTFTHTDKILINENIAHSSFSNNKVKIRQYLKENLENKFPSDNQQDSLDLMIDFLTSLKLTLDVFNEEDKNILNEAERIYWKNFLIEKELLKKQIFFAAIGVIENMKYNHVKSQCLREENVENFLLETTEELLISQKKNYEAMKKKYKKSEIMKFEINPDFNNEICNETNLKNFFLNFYDFQDQTEYLNLISSNSNSSEIGIHNIISARLKYLLNPHLNAAILVLVKNQMIKSLTETPSLFSYNKANILSMIFNYTNYGDCIGDYKLIFKIYEDLISSNQYDQIVLTNCLVMFCLALIKKLKLRQNYKEINEIIKATMKYYTSSFNKRIDTEIFGLITCVIRLCSPEEIQKIFCKDNSTENSLKDVSLIFFDYDHSFLLKTVDLLFTKFNYRIYLIFNSASSISKLDQILESFFSDKIKWKKNSIDFERFYNIYLFIKKIITFDHKNLYLHSYSREIEDEIQKVLNLFKINQSKECLKLLNIIFKESIGYLIHKPNLMVHIINQFVNYIRLDHKNFLKLFDSITSLIYKLFSPRNIQIREYILLFKKSIEACVTPDSVKFYINLIRQLLVPRLGLMINNEAKYFEEFSDIVNVMKTNESKKYYCHLILSYVTNLFDDKISHSIIHSLIYKIQEEKSNSNNSSISLSKNKQVAALVSMLTAFLMKYELYIKTSTELVILKFKELNNKYFKNNGDASKIIRRSMSEFYNKYSYTFEFVNKNLSPECEIAIKELSKSHSYFI